MEKLSETTRRLMNERFGRDSLLALATVDGEKVRELLRRSENIVN